MTNRKNVILIGCGKQGTDAHLPALSECRNETELVAVVELQSENEMVRRKIERFNLPQPIIIGVEPQKYDNTYPNLTETIEAELRDKGVSCESIDGAIIATYGFHFPYTVWTLTKGWHTLVDKPLTIIPDMAVDPTKAQIMVHQFEVLTKRAEERGVLFMLATQRRYQAVYDEISRRVQEATTEIEKQYGNRAINWIHSIQSHTSDGWYVEVGRHPSKTYGGKLKNTGYHILDIVPWIMRHLEPPIDNAVIQASPLFSEQIYAQLGVPTSKRKSERNVGLVITFRNGENTYCVWNFSADHEGFSMYGMPGRKSHPKRRTKEDTLRISQGPFFRAYVRRLAKIHEENGSELGQKRHLDVEYSQSYDPRKDALELKRLSYSDCDAEPTKEFLRALSSTNPNSVTTLSPVCDHVVGIKLFASAYESIAKVYNGNFDPVFVKFNAGEWCLPSGR